jgi:hypothetical protein
LPPIEATATVPDAAATTGTLLPDFAISMALAPSLERCSAAVVVTAPEAGHTSPPVSARAGALELNTGNRDAEIATTVQVR